MARTLRTGLTLGKFAPLHLGHQWLIESALAQVDHLIVMIYACGDLSPVSLDRRAAWIAELYPCVEVILAPDGPQDTGDTPEICARHEAYLAQRLAGRRITHFFSSEFYGDHVSRFLGAKDCRVDEGRVRVPISATRIRADYYAHRHWLHPRVYSDHVKKILFLGAPSTGKTTLAQALAARLNTCWMPEYGREYWEQHQHNRRLSPAQLLHIAQTHQAREEVLVQQSRNFLFVDTSALTTWLFARDYHGAALPALSQLAADSARRYDRVFLCASDIPFADTPDRSGTVQRERFQRAYLHELEARGMAYSIVRGALDARCAQIEKALKCQDT